MEMEYSMSKKLKTLCALVCTVFLLAGTLCLPGSAVDLPDTVEQPEVITCIEIPLYENDEYIGTGLKIGSLTYVPLLAFCEAMLDEECTFVWDQESAFTSISGTGLEISLTIGENYMVANGRYIYLAEGAHNVNGSIVVPIRELAKVFGVEVLWDYDNWTVDLNTDNYCILESGDTFYDETDLYWLSHVIYAESGNQSLEGMMGVGNVVLNRLRDESGAFPDTIKGIIFQYGQFAVAETGAIYLDPNPGSVVAAKLCLEGYNTVENALFFLNPKMCSDYWFRNTRTFLTTIGDHDFYA